LEHETDGTRFRLLGVGVNAIDSAAAADPADLVDGRAALAEYAVDDLRARFGDAVLVRGLGFEPSEK
jgi:DNA polymerase-4